MSGATRSIQPFVRPNYNVPDRLFNMWLPPQPTNQLQYIVPENLRATRTDYLLALRQFCITLVVFGGQIWLFRWMAQPPIVILLRLFWRLEPMLGTGFEVLRWLVVVAICVYIAAVALRDNNRLSSFGLRAKLRPAALWAYYLNGATNAIAIEEQWYREGAEHWSRRQRLVSNFVFGVSHLTTVVYPIASYLPLCLLGHTLTRVYLQELQRTGSRDKALARVIVVHRLCNWTTIAIVVPYILLLVALA